MEVTFDMIRSSPEIRTYITQADVSLTALGFTEHAFATWASALMWPPRF